MASLRQKSSTGPDPFDHRGLHRVQGTKSLAEISVQVQDWGTECPQGQQVCPQALTDGPATPAASVSPGAPLM